MISWRIANAKKEFNCSYNREQQNKALIKKLLLSTKEAKTTYVQNELPKQDKLRNFQWHWSKEPPQNYADRIYSGQSADGMTAFRSW